MPTNPYQPPGSSRLTAIGLICLVVIGVGALFRWVIGPIIMGWMAEWLWVIKD